MTEKNSRAHDSLLKVFEEKVAAQQQVKSVSEETSAQEESQDLLRKKLEKLMSDKNNPKQE